MFEEVQGRDLATVTFVRDYVQLGFDGPSFTLVVDPVVKSGGHEFRRKDNGFCDALVSLINKRLLRCELEENVSMRLLFDSGESLMVPLGDEVRGTNPEAVIYYASGNNVASVW